MSRIIVFVMMMMMMSTANADALLLNDLKARNARLLPVSEVRELIAGAKVVISYANGSTGVWTNDASGKFIAYNDGKSAMCGYTPCAGTSRGTWHIEDNGSYCVNIEWGRLTETWCSHLFALNNTYYGVASLSDGTVRAWHFDISK